MNPLVGEPGLHTALYNRGLLSAFDSRPRWCTVPDRSLVEYAKNLMARNGLTTRNDLRRAESGLYYALWYRNLLGQVAPVALGPTWSKMDDPQLIAYTRRYMAESGVTTRGKMWYLNKNLYNELVIRKLLDEAGVGRIPRRDWKGKSDDEVIAYAQREIDEKRLRNREELKDSDRGPYDAVRQRGLFGKLRFYSAEAGACGREMAV